MLRKSCRWTRCTCTRVEIIGNKGPSLIVMAVPMEKKKKKKEDMIVIRSVGFFFVFCNIISKTLVRERRKRTKRG